MDDEGEEGFVDGVVAYVGETLMRMGGGSWTWDPDSETTMVQPDTNLELTPVRPRQLLAAAVDTRDGQQFDAIYVTWVSAVEELTDAQPSWRPVKQPTPGLDSRGADDARLTTWLAERSAGFTTWVSTYAPDGTWDFTPESLDALEEAVRRLTPTTDVFDGQANQGFLDGATWYLGEVLCRGLGGKWFYRAGREYGGKAGAYVDQVGPRGEVLTPSTQLRVTLRKPGYLRQRYIQTS